MKSQLKEAHCLVNGELFSLPTSLMLDGLLEQLGWAGRRIALERNGTIVPRPQFARTQVQAGDRIEIVRAVGGG